MTSDINKLKFHTCLKKPATKSHGFVLVCMNFCYINSNIDGLFMGLF